MSAAKVTAATIKALTILKDTNFEKRMTMSSFALEMWADSGMHTSSKNTGNGACSGKAAWLVAGSYLAKLAKQKLVYKDHDEGSTKVRITEEGRRVLRESQTTTDEKQ